MDPSHLESFEGSKSFDILNGEVKFNRQDLELGVEVQIAKIQMGNFFKGFKG